MTIDKCDPCDGCKPVLFADKESFMRSVGLVLCAINENIGSVTGGGVERYDVEFLCDPGDSRPILVRYSYQTDGTVNGIAAFELDGTVYAGVIDDLVACTGGGGSGGDVNLIEVGGSPVALGQNVEAASIPVVPSLDQVVHQALVTIGFGALAATYNPVGVLTVGNALQFVVQNLTDAAIVLSFDGGTTDHKWIAAQSARTIDLAGLGRFEANDPQVKYDTLPTSGNVYFEAVK